MSKPAYECVIVRYTNVVQTVVNLRALDFENAKPYISRRRVFCFYVGLTFKVTVSIAAHVRHDFFIITLNFREIPRVKVLMKFADGYHCARVTCSHSLNTPLYLHFPMMQHTSVPVVKDISVCPQEYIILPITLFAKYVRRLLVG